MRDAAELRGRPPAGVPNDRPDDGPNDGPNGGSANAADAAPDAGTKHDRALEILSPEECVDLLSQRSIGRVVFTDKALPAVQPVSFCMDGDVIVVRTGTSSRLGIAAPDTVVGFEVDEIEPVRMHGWVVTAIGQAEIVTDALAVARLGALSLPAWKHDGPSRFLRIRPRMLRGERTLALTTFAS